jgi:hypothetical protein
MKEVSTDAAMAKRTDLRTQGQQLSAVEPGHLDRIFHRPDFRPLVSEIGDLHVVEES